MPKLTDTQLTILNTAAGRETRAILPLPKSLKVNKGTATSVLKAMVTRGLIEERPARPGNEAWRKDDDGHGFVLVLTEAGLAALDEGPADKTRKAQPAKAAKRPPAASSPATAPPRGGKAETILALVCRPEGARIAELQKATGWQPHSVRAALTGLRKRGIEVTRAKEGDATVYHAKAA